MRAWGRVLGVGVVVAALLGAMSGPLLLVSGFQGPAAPSAQTRLVVFEAFMRTGCGFSNYAGGVIDSDVAPTYAGQPVIFIEYDIDSIDPQFEARESRWWDAKGGGGATLPLTMVDSGNQFYDGITLISTIYKGMVNTALTRPPQAEIRATWRRVGNTVSFSAEVTNLSGVTLSSTNKATVWGIVYESSHVVNTDHYVRAIASTPISSLAPGATESFDLQTAALPAGTNWTRLHYVVLVDYRPNPALRPYDMLQAVVAQQEPRFRLQPDSLTWMVDPADTAPPAAEAELVASQTLNWAAQTSHPWLTITPASGNTTIKPTVSAVTGTLSPGWQRGVITFTATSGEPFSDTLTVDVYYGPVERVYIPCVFR